MELTQFLELWNCEIIMEFSKEENMERYKSIVKSVVVSGARHAFLLNDGITWLSVFLRRDQKPEFQQAVRGVSQGQEYIFDCVRNERNFLNIVAIQHPTWPTPIPAKDVQPGAPAQAPPAAPPPMPGPTTAQPAPQPVAQVLAPIQTSPPSPAAVPPLPPVPPQAESPAMVTLGPSAAYPAGDQGAPPITELTEAAEVSVKDRLIARENAANATATILSAIIEKGQLPEDVESFITWVGVKFVQLQDVIASNTLKVQSEEEIPF